MFKILRNILIRKEPILETFSDNSLLYDEESETEADPLLQEIVGSVVNVLNFQTAMVSIVSHHNGQLVLSVRAFSYASPLSKLAWQEAGKKLQGTVLNIGEKIAGQKLIGNYVTLDKTENLGVRVILENRQYATTNSLYDLFANRVDKTTADKLQVLTGLKAFITVPFKDAQENLIGNLFAGTESLDFTQEEIQSIKAFSRMASFALQNSQLHRKSESFKLKYQTQLKIMERQNHQLQALQGTSVALLESTLRMNKVLQKIVDGVVEAFDFQAVFLSLVERDEQNNLILPVKTYSINSRLSGKKLLEQGQRILRKELIGSYVNIDETVAEKNVGVRIILDQGSSVRTDGLVDMWYPTASEKECNLIENLLEMETFATIPIWTISKGTNQKELLGNLYVGSGRKEITDEEIKSLETFALQASIAIRNAKLYLVAQQIADMGSLTSNLGHKLNGLIGKMSYWVQKSREQLENDSIDLNTPENRVLLQSRLQKTNINLNKSAALIDRLRTQAKEGVEIRLVNVNEVIHIAINASKIPDNIRVDTNLEKGLPLVSAVKLHLIEVFEILITNSLDAMSERDGHLIITSSRTGEYVKAVVEDNGVGISQENLQKLFSLGATYNKEGGMGYGLWWAKASLGWIDGEINVESEEDMGSIFTISIPLEQ